MIIDHIDNIMKYEALLPGIRAGMEAVRALEEPGAAKAPEAAKEAESAKIPADPGTGRYEFEGGYFMVQKGNTRPLEEGTFEAHQKYIDVQILTEGSEEVAWEDIRRLEIVIPYNPEKDAMRLTGNREHVMKISKGMFYAAFPQDGHQPVSHTGKMQSFTKIVMKLPVRPETDQDSIPG